MRTLFALALGLSMAACDTNSTRRPPGNGDGGFPNGSTDLAGAVHEPKRRAPEQRVGAQVRHVLVSKFSFDCGRDFFFRRGRLGVGLRLARRNRLRRDRGACLTVVLFGQLVEPIAQCLTAIAGKRIAAKPGAFDAAVDGERL